MSPNALIADQVSFAYNATKGGANGSEDSFYALRDIDLALQAGQFVALLGCNGSGKSTLAKLCNGLLLPTSGQISVDGFFSTADDNWELRRRVGMVFQDPGRQLVAALVEDDICFGLENLGISPQEMQHRLETVLQELHIEELAQREPHYLSGGQKQRVAIAGVLVMQPSYMIFDEPTAMLDSVGRKNVLQLIKGVQSKLGIGVLYITHLMEEVLFADRVVILNKGKVIGDFCPAEAIFQNYHLVRSAGLQLPLLLELREQLRQLKIDIPDNCRTPESLAGYLASRILASEYSDARVSFQATSVSNRVARSADNAPVGEAIDRNGTGALKQDDGGTDVEPFIAIENASFSYLEGTPFACQALNNVNLKIYPGEFVGIMGTTGSGKSSLVQLFNGLVRAQSGQVKIKGKVIPTGGGGKFLAQVRAEIGFLFQFSEQQLFENTVIDDVSFAPRNMGLAEEEVRKRALYALDLVGLPADFYERSPLTLSGGEKRRVALAGVLAAKPSCLILDEPTAGLDPQNATELLKLLKRLNSQDKITIVMISHRYEEVASVARRLVVMHKGRAVLDGAVEDVLYDIAALGRVELEHPVLSQVFIELHKRGLLCDCKPVTVSEAVECLASALCS